MKAFPTQYVNGSVRDEGMDLRDYFAAKAFQVLMKIAIETNSDLDDLEVCVDCYKMADAMMEARK